MQYRKLGSSDLIVSEIALGSWLTYSGGVDRDRSIACVRRALDLGITLLDTANVYGRGAARHSWAKHSREWIALATSWRRSSTSR